MNNLEFSKWQQLWQSHRLVPIELVRRVERQTLRLQALRVAEIAVTIVMGGGLIGATIVHPLMPQTYWVALTLITWIFIIAAWTISLRISRSAWNVAEPSISAYVDLQVRRYQQQINGIRSGSIASLLFSTGVLIVVFEALNHSLKAHNVTLPLWSIVYFWTVGIVVNGVVLLGQVAKKKKLQSELNNMLDVQRAIS
jgi:divalent metal cation (Fe/Co/Zn/Cd) transporter